MLFAHPAKIAAIELALKADAELETPVERITKKEGSTSNSKC